MFGWRCLLVEAPLFYVLFKVFSCKSSTSLAVLQYFPESTGVLPLQYCGTFLEVLVL